MAFEICGCTTEKRADTPSSNAAIPVIRSEIERGPVKLTLEVVPDKPRLSDEPELTLTIRAKQGVQVNKPPFGDALGDFVIRNYYEPAPEVESGVEIIRQIYTLEPTRAGKLTIAPIAIRFHDARTDGDGKEHSIESEALTIEINTVLGDDAPSLANLRSVAGPIELHSALGSGWWWLVGVVVLCLTCFGIIWKVRKRSRVSEPGLSSQELAWLELQQIVDRDLAANDVKEYYVELTGVVRRYIERSTGVHAPEQTTEEFLREIVGHSVFADNDQRRLKNFLESADLVKFAGYKPNVSDIEASFDRAKEFIGLQRQHLHGVAA